MRWTMISASPLKVIAEQKTPSAAFGGFRLAGSLGFLRTAASGGFSAGKTAIPNFGHTGLARFSQKLTNMSQCRDVCGFGLCLARQYGPELGPRWLTPEQHRGGGGEGVTNSASQGGG